jgi:hypothetical protein
MPNAELPQRPSLEFLKTIAKDRLQLLRRSDPKARLATALLEVARDYGFSSWRALKKHVDDRGVPTARSMADFTAQMARLSKSVAKGVPMIHVPDVAHAIDWYVSIGFKELNRFEDDGEVNFGMVAFGGAELMLNMHGTRERMTSACGSTPIRWTRCTKR